jgi:hypothetical protein
MPSRGLVLQVVPSSRLQRLKSVFGFELYELPKRVTAAKAAAGGPSQDAAAKSAAHTGK